MPLKPFNKYFLLFFFIVISLQAKTKNDSLKQLLKIKAETLGVEPFKNKAFGLGEELNFEIYWKYLFAVTAGYTTMAVKDTIRYKGRLCYRVLVTTKSTKFISNFYTLNDSIQTYIDVEYGMSWAYIKKTRESNFFSDTYVYYDHLNDSAEVTQIRYEDVKAKRIIKKEIYRTEIKPFTQDILSSFYYMRTLSFQPNTSIFITNHSDRKNYELEVKVKNLKTEETDAGTFKVLPLFPIVQGANIINTKSDMQVWVTDDKYHMPVRMRTEVAIGSVNVALIKYKKHD